MEFKDIKQLAQLMKDMGLTTLEYSEGEKCIHMERGAVVSAPAVCIEAKAEAAVTQSSIDVPSDVSTITSPMVGVFYAAPGTDKKPYVSIGDHVNAGDVLCIIEAMKMMNEITAEKSGVITEICVGNKQIVEYGHPLFRYQPD